MAHAFFRTRDLRAGNPVVKKKLNCFRKLKPKTRRGKMSANKSDELRHGIKLASVIA